MSQILINKANVENVFPALRAEWQQLFAEAECSPFLSWEWLATWYKSFGANTTPFILTAYRNHQLVGILPLYLQEKKVLGMKLRKLGFIGEAQGGADYLDLIAKSQDKTEVLSAIFDFLKAETSFDLLSLENLASNSVTIKFLQDFSQRETKQRWRYSDLTNEICPQIDISEGWESVLKQSKRASNFKRRLKQLEKMSGFEFRSITAANEIEAAFERFYRLHEKRWANDGGSELSGHPRLVSFQQDLVKNLANSNFLRFDELWIEGKCRASVYGLDHGKIFYYYNSGYDLAWANKSVGLVLIGLSVKNAIVRGNSLYDFLRGDENYKFDWANQKAELVNINLSRPTLSTFADAAIEQTSLYLRKISKSALPAGLTEKIKNYRRNWKRNYQLSNLEVERTPEVYES